MGNRARRSVRPRSFQFRIAPSDVASCGTSRMAKRSRRRSQCSSSCRWRFTRWSGASFAQIRHADEVDIVELRQHRRAVTRIVVVEERRPLVDRARSPRHTLAAVFEEPAHRLRQKAAAG